jgi:hypothetical protein
MLAAHPLSTVHGLARLSRTSSDAPPQEIVLDTELLIGVTCEKPATMF